MRFLRRRQSWLLRWGLSAMMEISALMPLPIVVLALGGDRSLLAAVPGYGPLLAAYGAAGLVEAASRKEADGAALIRRIAGAVVGTAVAYIWSYAFLPEGFGAEGPFELNPALAVLPFAWIAWGWGSDAVGKGLDYYSLFDRFKARAVLMVVAIIALLIAGVAGAGEVDLLLYWNVVLFFTSGLTVLFLARQHLLRIESQHIGDEGPGATEQPVITWLVVGLLVLSLAAAHLLSVDMLAATAHEMFGLLRPVINWLWDVLFLFIQPYLYIIFMLINAIANAVRRLPIVPRDPQEQGPGQPEPFELPEPEEGVGADGYPWMQWVLVGIAAVALIWWMFRIKRKRVRAESADVDDLRESLGFWSQVMADLSSLWALFRGRLRPFPLQTGLPGSPADLPAELTPRALFLRLQRWGSALGRRRGDAETPEQYRRALSLQSPDSAGNISVVTELYNRARYGQREPRQAEVQRGGEAISALEQIQRPEIAKDAK